MFSNIKNMFIPIYLNDDFITTIKIGPEKIERNKSHLWPQCILKDSKWNASAVNVFEGHVHLWKIALTFMEI